MSRPYGRRTWRGVVLNNRTIDMLEWAERKSGVTVTPSQGSYTGGAVAASGSTHNGGGAVDIRSSILSPSSRKRLVKALKDAGFAAWYRGPKSGFSPHIHAIALRDKQASTSAKWQMQEYLAGRSGLTSSGRDTTYRPDPQVRWSWKRQKPVAL